MGIYKNQVKKGPVIWADGMRESSGRKHASSASILQLTAVPSRIMLDLKGRGRKLTFIK